jgi:hypothetical protein
MRACESLAAGGRSLVVADAKTVYDCYERAYRRHTELVPYGADPPSDRGTTVLERFGLKPEGYLLFVGRLVPENAPD